MNLLKRWSQVQSQCSVGFSSIAIDAGINYLWIGQEMSSKDNTRRLCSIMTGIDNTRMQTGNLTAKEAIKIKQAEEQIANSGFYYAKPSDGHIDEILSIIDEYRWKYDIKGVIWDYIQLITTATGQERFNREQIIGHASKIIINKVVTNWETLEKNRNDFKQLYYDFKDREFEIRSREDLTEVTDDINLLIDEIKDANSEDNITLIPKIIYKEALTVAEEKKVQPKIDYLFNSLGMTHKLNEELITKAETYANSAEVIACDKASGEEKKEACTKKKKTGKAIVLEEEILEEMMLEEGATPYLTAPIFDGDGLYGGANTTEMYLDNNISKERDLKMLIIGWTLFLLPIAALMAVLAIVWAGILYVTAIGDDGRIETAKKIILWVIIGILAILSAYAIVNTVMQAAF